MNIKSKSSMEPIVIILPILIIFSLITIAIAISIAVSHSTKPLNVPETCCIITTSDGWGVI